MDALNDKGIEKRIFDPFHNNFLNSFSDDNLNIFHETQMNLLNAPYIDPYDFKISNGSNSISILHVNIRSMQHNFEKLKEFLIILKYIFDVIAISETWHDTETLIESNSNFILPNYRIISQPRGRGKKGGGLCFYILEKYTYKIKKQLCLTKNDYECLTIEIINEKAKNIVIVCVYRPPSGTVKPFEDFIRNLIVNNNNKKLCIIGDINLNSLTYEKNLKIKSFFDMLFKYNIYPLINKPTRITKSSATAIDNIFLNHFLETSFETGIFKTDISDHFPIYIKINNLNINSTTYSKKINIKKRNLSTVNTHNFSQNLYKERWNEVYVCQNTNEAYNAFINKFLNIFNETIPYEIIKTKTKTLANPWMNKSLVKCSKKKQKLYNKFLKNRNIENENKYKNYKYFYQNLLKNEKKQFYSNKIYECKSDIKKTWSVINNIMGRNKSSSLLPLNITINDINIHCPTQISKEFNNYFTNVGLNLANKIVPPLDSFNTYLNSANKNLLCDSELTLKEIDEAFSSLKINKSPGFDGISSNLVIFNKNHIIKPLFHVLKLSINEGVFPETLKVAKVYPIYKGKDSSDISNYRPISVLSVFSKIFERVMYSRIYAHFTKNNLFYSKQFGFQKNFSTEHAILEIVDHITTGFEKNEFTLGIFIDLSKAFDTVNHSILLEKINYYGVTNKTYSWIKSYLTDRKQYVINPDSGTLNIMCGVPQGSILGPLLFLIYINDFCNVSANLNSIMYADDTNLFMSKSDINQLYGEMNIELVKVNKWFRANKLSINVKKTQYTLFYKKTQEENLPLKLPFLSINNKQIKKKECLKFLGVYVDENLSWLSHIKYIESKIKKTIGIMYRVSPLINSQSLKLIYFSLIHSYINYGNIAWASTQPAKLKRILSVQKHACRIIFRKNKFEHAKPLMRKMQMMNVYEINKFQHMIFMYNHFNNLTPKNFEKKFKINQNSNYSLRSNERITYTLPRKITKYKEYSITYRGPMIWNSFKKNHINLVKTVNSFKFHTKREILKSNDSFKT